MSSQGSKEIRVSQKSDKMSLNSAPPQDTVESNIQDNTEVVEGEGSQMDQEPKGVCTECILTKENLKIMSQSL